MKIVSASPSVKVMDLKRGCTHQVKVIPGTQLVEPELSHQKFPSLTATSCNENQMKFSKPPRFPRNHLTTTYLISLNDVTIK